MSGNGMAPIFLCVFRLGSPRFASVRLFFVRPNKKINMHKNVISLLFSLRVSSRLVLYSVIGRKETNKVPLWIQQFAFYTFSAASHVAQYYARHIRSFLIKKSNKHLNNVSLLRHCSFFCPERLHSYISRGSFPLVFFLCPFCLIYRLHRGGSFTTRFVKLCPYT